MLHHVSPCWLATSYPLVICYIAMGKSPFLRTVNHHFFLWAMASMAMLNNQRVKGKAPNERQPSPSTP